MSSSNKPWRDVEATPSKLRTTKRTIKLRWQESPAGRRIRIVGEPASFSRYDIDGAVEAWATRNLASGEVVLHSLDDPVGVPDAGLNVPAVRAQDHWVARSADGSRALSGQVLLRPRSQYRRDAAGGRIHRTIKSYSPATRWPWRWQAAVGLDRETEETSIRAGFVGYLMACEAMATDLEQAAAAEGWEPAEVRTTFEGSRRSLLQELTRVGDVAGQVSELFSQIAQAVEKVGIRLSAPSAADFAAMLVGDRDHFTEALVHEHTLRVHTLTGEIALQCPRGTQGAQSEPAAVAWQTERLKASIRGEEDAFLSFCTAFEVNRARQSFAEKIDIRRALAIIPT